MERAYSYFLGTKFNPVWSIEAKNFKNFNIKLKPIIMFSISEMFSYLYEKIIKKNSFNELDRRLRAVAIDVKIFRNPDYSLYKYILEKSIWSVKESIGVCYNDDGTIEYILFVTKHKYKVNEAKLLIESMDQFKYVKGNIKELLYSTPTSGLYASIIENHNSNDEFGVRLMYGELAN